MMAGATTLDAFGDQAVSDTAMNASLPVVPGHEGFVRPSSYLQRPRGFSRPMNPPKALNAVDREQRKGLVSISILPYLTLPALRTYFYQANAQPLQRCIREFLKVRTSYDVLPVSFRLIILDTTLLVKKSLTTLIQNGRLLFLYLEIQ